MVKRIEKSLWATGIMYYGLMKVVWVGWQSYGVADIEGRP